MLTMLLYVVCSVVDFECMLVVDKPPAPSRVQLVRATTSTLEVCWGNLPTGMFSLSSHLFCLSQQDLLFCFVTHYMYCCSIICTSFLYSKYQLCGSQVSH